MTHKGTQDREPFLQFKNCRLLYNHELIEEDLWCQGGKIVNPEKVFFDERASADTQIDCHGGIISPGYIDVQINGVEGVDFSRDTENVQAGINKAAKKLLEYGVTSFCPTVVSSPESKYHEILPHLKKSKGTTNGAGVLGVHLEGPFISDRKNGAHLKEYLKKFPGGFQDILRVYGTLDDTAIITLAPELENSKEIIKELVQRNITVSLGHSMANLSEGEMAVTYGASFITHLFNAMQSFHHRDPHLVGLIASDKIPKGRQIYFGLIADGVHTHPVALRFANLVHPKGLVIITDAVPAMGLPKGKHTIGPQQVEILEDRAVLAGTSTLCGSIMPMNECVKYFYKSTNCNKEAALEMASLHPAQLLGITNQKGSLNFGTDADFVLLDDELNVQATYIASELAWENPSARKGVKKYSLQN